MAHDIGDTVVLAVKTYDADGALADVGAMAATVTLPDGSTTSPAIEHVAASGLYVVRYATVQAGRHLIRWVGTGANAATHSEAFDVRVATPVYLVSLAQAKRKCNIDEDDTSRDEDLRDYIEAATVVVEDHVCKVIARRTVTETIRTNWSRTVVLSSTPVISLTSVVSIDGLSTWDVANLHVDTTTGIVTVKSGQPLGGDLTFTYVAGMTVVPANYIKAALIIIEHLFGTDRPLQSEPAASMYDDSMDGTTRSAGFAIPNRALELLGKPPPLVG